MFFDRQAPTAFIEAPLLGTSCYVDCEVIVGIPLVSVNHTMPAISQNQEMSIVFPETERAAIRG